MKHRISYSVEEKLYKIESKHLFGKWETRKNYLFTDNEGNIIEVKGFSTYDGALEWMNDRFMNLYDTNNSRKNDNIGFEF